jgi:hypothetical protein
MTTQSNPQAQPAKKLKLNKETLRQLSSQSAWITSGSFMPTATCNC